MKKFVLLLLAIATFSYFASAQSLDGAFAHLEEVRIKKGELSQEYLFALDTVIWKANMAGENETALAYRKNHLDIVKQMKGENCVEVADDLWRLGNTSYMQGDSIKGLTYYLQAAELFDRTIELKRDTIYLWNYLTCLFSIAQQYAIKGDNENTALYSSKFVNYYSIIEGKGACSYFEALCIAGDFIRQTGDIDNAIQYYKRIVDESVVVDSCNYVSIDAAYSLMKSYYYHTNQNDLQIATAIEHFNKLDLDKYAFLNEKTNALLYLLVCDVQDMNEAYAFGLKAEQLLKNAHNSNGSLFQDPKYFEVVSHLAFNRYLVNDFVQGKVYYQLCCDILKENGLKKSKDYYDAFYKLFECASKLGEDYQVVSLASEIEPLIFIYSETPVQDACDYAAKMYGSSLRLGRYDDALHYCDEYFSIAEQIDAENSITIIADHAFAKAQIYSVTGRKQEALSCIYEGKTKIQKEPETPMVLYIKSRLLGQESLIVSDYENALSKSDSALLICEHLIEEAKSKIPTAFDGSNSITSGNGLADDDILHNMNWLRTLQDEYANNLLNKGLMLYNHGAIAEAYSTFQKYSLMIEETGTKNSSRYIVCQNNIALCQMNMGDYSDAINTLNELKDILEVSSGANSQLYAVVLLNHALYYNVIGDYDKVIDFSQKAATISDQIGDIVNYAKAVANIGTGYYTKGNPNEALKYLEEALGIMESIEAFGPELSKVYQNMSMASYELDRLDEGYKYFQKASQMIESVYGKQSVEYAELSGAAGWEMYRNGYDGAFDAYMNAVGAMQSVGRTNHPTYLRALTQYGIAGSVFEKPIVSDYTQLLLDAYRSYYDYNIAFFSSSDRSYLWNSLSGVKDVVFSAHENMKTDYCKGEYDFVLFNRSLMLNTSNRFKSSVYQTKDESLIKQFEEIVMLQKMIDNQNFNVSAGGLSMEDMSERLDAMEKDLIGKMKESGAYTTEKDITYKDVAKVLKPNEIAVEFVDYNNLKDHKTYYVALLAKSSWENPVYVQLCAEEDLKNCIGNPNITYSTDDLYRFLWQPLLKYVGDSCTVYFSPSGMLHTIALESIHTPDGSCLNDKYNLVRLTSTRELCKERQPKTYETGAVYGGLQYDVEQQRMAEVAAMNKAEFEESPAFALRGEDRGNWNYLQGTKDEVEHIAGIMRQANINCNLLEGDLGNEESFKALSGGKTDIIHLATHGYFLEGEKADMNDFMKSLSPLARQKTDSVIDPLLRSGLILSGGNRAWLGQEVPEGIEDGVLTALEISTMNLSGTDMVVMSACETGLGDITSDGVFGLQRAFKMAGVQTLVMSLWKVDDNATSLMMQTFYEHLLSGMSKRDAFNLAQAAVRAKYPEPYYWAGFVMLD